MRIKAPVFLFFIARLFLIFFFMNLLYFWIKIRSEQLELRRTQNATTHH